MLVGKLLACERYGPLGIIGCQGAVVFLEGGAPGGRSTVGVLRSSGRKVTKVATSPIRVGSCAAGRPGRAASALAHPIDASLRCPRLFLVGWSALHSGLHDACPPQGHRAGRNPRSSPA